MKRSPSGIQPDAAGIDIGATEIYVAVPEERDIRPVRKFPTFTEDLYALGDWLVGDYRPEHLFSLQQALENYRHFQNQVAACDQHIERMLARFDSQEQCAQAPSTKYKAQGNQPTFDVPSEMHRILGVDLTAIPGMSAQAVLTFFC